MKLILKTMSMSLLVMALAAQSLQGMRPIDQPVQERNGRNDRTMLMICAKNGYLAGVKRTVDEEGADVNVVTSYGNALHGAAEGGNPEVAQFLLDRGARVDERNEYGSTPLFIAASHGSLDVARVLLDNGANPVNAQDQYGNTILAEAIKSVGTGGEHFEIIKLLIARGASPWLTDRWGSTALEVVEDAMTWKGEDLLEELQDIATYIKRYSMQVSVREKGKGTQDINFKFQ